MVLIGRRLGAFGRHGVPLLDRPVPARNARPGRRRMVRGLGLDLERRYFVFYSQFLAFKFSESEIVGVRSLTFVFDFLLEG